MIGDTPEDIPFTIQDDSLWLSPHPRDVSQPCDEFQLLDSVPTNFDTSALDARNSHVYEPSDHSVLDNTNPQSTFTHSWDDSSLFSPSSELGGLSIPNFYTQGDVYPALVCNPTEVKHGDGKVEIVLRFTQTSPHASELESQKIVGLPMLRSLYVY